MVAGFDGVAVTSDAGVLLRGAAGRATGLVGRFAACFRAPPCHGARRARGATRYEKRAANRVAMATAGMILLRPRMPPRKRPSGSGRRRHPCCRCPPR